MATTIPIDSLIKTGATSPTKPAPDYSTYEQGIKSAAASTRKEESPTIPGVSPAKKAARTLNERNRAIGNAAIENYRAQEEGIRKQAEKAATGLELAGQATIDYTKSIDALKGDISQQVANASDSWDRAATKADEYVQKAGARVKEVLSNLDTINQEFAVDRGFAKAHDMQVASQAVLGTMRAEERNILEVYGADSKEYQGFVLSKQTALASAQSNIHASYQKLAEAQNQTYMNVVSDAHLKGNMYLGYQEQQHVEMLKFSEQSKAAYSLQSSELNMSLETARMNGLENLANWIIDTPTFTMDSTPLLTLISDLGQVEDTNELTKFASMNLVQEGYKPVSGYGGGTGYAPNMVRR
jgi:hypothetical protein